MKMYVKHIEQSLAAKPWVRTFAIIDPQADKPVYAWGNAGNAAYHADCLMDPSNNLVNKTGAWSAGAFRDDDNPGLNLAFARDVGGYAVLVEADIEQINFATMKRGAKSLAHAAKHALKSAGLYHALYENC